MEPTSARARHLVGHRPPAAPAQLLDFGMPPETDNALGLPRPVLHLSGAKLRTALEALIKAAEPVGGVERMAQAVRLRGEVLRDRFGGSEAQRLTRAGFEEVVVLMPTVRRRVGATIEACGSTGLREAIAVLLDGAAVPGTADARIARFEAALMRGAAPHGSIAAAHPPAPLPVAPAESAGRRGDYPARFLRDLAAEILHAVHPEPYPLMTRWVWDAKANTGVLREIWHDARSGSDEVDHIVIDVPDTHDTFLVLREELSQFLADNGVFRDMLWYVDLMCAQVYGGYINAQGGAYLKADFSSEADPLEQTRRILGLDLRSRAGGQGPVAFRVRAVRDG